MLPFHQNKTQLFFQKILSIESAANIIFTEQGRQICWSTMVHFIKLFFCITMMSLLTQFSYQEFV